MSANSVEQENSRYLAEANARLQNLSIRIKEFQAKRARRSEALPTAEQAYLPNFDLSWSALRTQLDGLAASGEKHWLTLQTNLELGMWNLRAALQRALDGVQPALAAGDEESPRYFIQRSEHGRWGLQRQGSPHAVKYFDRKKDALPFSRRYVRQRAPSQLITRRRDGTFEAVHTYR